MPKAKKTTKVKKSVVKQSRVWLLLAAVFVLVGIVGLAIVNNHRSNDLSNFQATPFNRVQPLIKTNAKLAALVNPNKVKTAYHLNGAGTGSGTIAIIDAYDYPTAEADLATFDSQYGVAACTTVNGCFEKHPMVSRISTSPDWAVESALDVQWAHSIAPTAKILLVEAKSSGGNDLMDAINYARGRRDVVAISMSWGGNEFSSERSYEPSFTSSFGATFFAASGDNGHGTSWPAVSANVVSVGGTSLHLDANGNFLSETAWNGSGGGLSTYITEPASQTAYNVPSASHHRAVPDVAYNADPNNGYPVYDSTSYFGYKGWFQVGGTSAGTPQWAAIRSISSTLTQTKLYQDAKLAPGSYFRDITTGTNGTCGLYCNTVAGYDYVTGLGSPLTKSF